MLVHITNVKKITAKKTGDPFLIISFVKPDGQVGTSFMPQPKVTPLPNITEEELASFQSTDISFDDKGRAVSVGEPQIPA